MTIGTMSTTQPIRAAKLRNGDVIIVDGTNNPLRWDGNAAAAWNTGVIAPSTAPTIARVAAATKLVSTTASDSGLIKITTTTNHGYTTGTVVSIAGVLGTTEANGLWTITVLSATTFDLQGSTFANAYVSGGVVSLVTLAVTISGAVSSGAANLIKITTSTSHGYTTGQQVLITGVVGTTEANGTWILTVVDATHFTLNGSSFVNAYVSGGSASVTAAASAGSYSFAYRYLDTTTVNGTSRTINGAVADGTVIKITTSTAHGYSPGQLISISGVTGTTEANGIWAINVIDSTHFDLVGSTFTNAYVSGGTAVGVRTIAPGGVPSNFSPLTTINANWGDTFTWTYVDASATRAGFVELYRTTAGQTTTYYLAQRFAKGAGTTFTDKLSDTAISTNNVNLTGVFAPATALPFLQADETPNANRFVPPPSDAPYIVVLQDRLFMGGRKGDNRNILIYSEPDEPESMPDDNVVTVQDNTGDDDEITGLTRHGMRGYVLKQRHIYSLSFVKQPNIDASCFLVLDRGAISDRCVTWFEDMAYIMDTAGIYKYDGGRSCTPISEPLDNLWRDESATRIDFSVSKWFWSSCDPARRIVYFAVSFVGDSSTRPTRALVYHVDSGVWDHDAYPYELGGGALYPIGGKYSMVVGGAGGNVYVTGSGLTDAGTSINWTHKTGRLEYPVSDSKSKRSVYVYYNPTINATGTINLEVFRGFSTSPVSFLVPENQGTGVTSAAGNVNIALDITLNRSVRGPDQGYKQFKFGGLSDDLSQADRFVSFQLSGTQAADQITLYGYEIQGAAQE